MRSPLTEGTLPDTVTISGTAYQIRTDFRVGVRFEEMLADSTLNDEAKVALALALWFEQCPEAYIGDIIDAVLWFHRGGKEAGDGDDVEERVYSFSHDYDMLYAAFLSAYRIDLLDPDTRLHWWRFRAMLVALPEQSQFMRAVGWRCTEVTSDMPSDQRRHVRKMKRLFALPGTQRPRIQTMEELHARIAEVEAERAKSGG